MRALGRLVMLLAVAEEAPETRLALTPEGLHLAYQVSGSGPIDTSGALFIGTHRPTRPGGRVVVDGDAWRFVPA